MTKEQIIRLLQDTIDGLNGKESDIETVYVMFNSISGKKDSKKISIDFSIRLETDMETAVSLFTKQPINGYRFVLLKSSGAED